jgi:predicted acylesterase/phospholipase RssA
MSSPPNVNPQNLHLALSGGGFRATLFHLGIIRYLRETNRLSNLKAVTALSGGSILAAHLVLNWDKYTGTPERFAEATTELITFIQSDLRGRIVRKWYSSWALVFFLWTSFPNLVLFYCDTSSLFLPVFISVLWLACGLVLIAKNKNKWSLIRFLEREYASHLYSYAIKTHEGEKQTRATLSKLPAVTNAPYVYILATNLTSGRLCYFDSHGYNEFPPGQFSQMPPPRNVSPPGVPSPITHDLPNFSVARAVAASSAFPVVFSPVILTESEFGGPLPFKCQQALADGGIYDNMGLEALRCLRSNYVHTLQDVPTEYVISDGQGVFLDSASGGYSLLNQRASRLIEILMNRVTQWQLEEMNRRTIRGEESISLTYLKSTEEVRGRQALDPSVQRQIARIRTDLNSFTDMEIQLLVYHGFSVARNFYDPSTDDETGAKMVPPDGAYSEGWIPTSKVLQRDGRAAVRPWYRRIGAELTHGLCWVTVAALAASVFCLYPVLTRVHPALVSAGKSISASVFPETHNQEVFREQSDRYAEKLGLRLPPPSINFRRDKVELDSLGAFDGDSTYDVHPDYVKRKGMPEYTAMMSRFMFKHANSPKDEGFYNDFRNSVTSYILKTDGKSVAPWPVGEKRYVAPKGGKVYLALEKLQALNHDNPAPVRLLALELFEKYNPSWSASTFVEEALAINNGFRPCDDRDVKTAFSILTQPTGK